MERAVFVIAIAGAIFAGLWMAFGAGVITFSGNGNWQGVGEWSSPEAVRAAEPGRREAATYVAGEIEIINAAVRVVVIPEARQDVQIEIDNPGKAPMPEISLENGRLLIDGHLRGRIGDCDTDSVELRGYSRVTPEEMPLLTIHTPMNVDLEFGGAGNAQIGAAQALEFSMHGCASAEIADVAGLMDLDVSGRSNVTAGAANELNLDFAGVGDVATGAVAQGAEISMAGVGNTRIASLSGPLNFDGAGTGELWIGDGAITEAELSMSGVGRFEMAAGSVTHANISIAGPAAARFGGTVSALEASVAGPGSVDVIGAVGDLEAEIMGPGNVNVGALTGSLRKSVMGPGQVRVGGQPRG